MKAYIPRRVPKTIPEKVKSKDVNALNSSQERWIRENYPDMEDSDIANFLGMPEWLVPILAVKHKLKKSESFKEYMRDYEKMQRLDAIDSLKQIGDIKETIHNQDIIRGEEYALNCSFVHTREERRMMAKAIADALEWGRKHPSVKEALMAKNE